MVCQIADSNPRLVLNYAIGMHLSLLVKTHSRNSLKNHSSISWCRLIFSVSTLALTDCNCPATEILQELIPISCPPHSPVTEMSAGTGLNRVPFNTIKGLLDHPCPSDLATVLLV